MKKRGLSTVVASMLIILLAIVISGVVWFTVKNVIQEDAKKVSLSGLTVNLEIKSLKVTNDTMAVKVKRNPGEGNLIGLKFIIFDGQNSQEFERLDIGLDPLEIMTFILDYSGNIETCSVYPILESDTGVATVGSVSDVYYYTDGGSGGSGTGEEGNCTGDCGARECGLVPNGCGTSCGVCPPSDPFCDNGICTDTPCTPGCACSSTTCVGDLCLGGCNEVCDGAVPDDCNLVDCGPSPNGCSDNCADCETGYHCDGGACVSDCIVNCTGLECGPDLNGCTESCGSCDIPAGEWCDNGLCSNNTCVANCSGRVCGVDPLCGDPCLPGCNISIGEWCNEDGECLTEQYINNGTVFSIWPVTIGIYFDSTDLPKSGVDYTDYYARFPGSLELRCLQIREYVIPVIPEVYNLSHVRFVTSSTAIQPNDQYEIWETYVGCINA